MKVLVTGVNGQLGHDVMNELYRRNHTGVGTGRTAEYSGARDASPVCSMPYISLDLTDEELVKSTMTALCPDVVVHCAAWTAVDAAEDPDNRPAVWASNADATRYIAEACRGMSIPMVYISTDYVFDGSGERPWQPDDTDFGPLCEYGRSKLAGERAVRELLDRFFIVRTAWVFGLNGNNFIRTMLKVGRSHDTLRVVNDQIGAPTYTFDLARLLVDMIETDKYGCYHATNEGGYISWYDFAKEIFRQAGMDTVVLPVSTEEYGLSKAVRPHNSRLDTSKLQKAGFRPLPSWEDALRRFLNDLRKQE